MLQSKIEKPDRTGGTVSESKSHKFLPLALHKNVGRLIYTHDTHKLLDNAHDTHYNVFINKRYRLYRKGAMQA